MELSIFLGSNKKSCGEWKKALIGKELSSWVVRPDKYQGGDCFIFRLEAESPNYLPLYASEKIKIQDEFKIKTGLDTHRVQFY